jgi:hypothetical protein
MAHPVTMCEFHQGIKRDKTFCQVMKEDNDFNEWTRRVVVVPQMNCTHSIFNESHILKDDGGKTVFWKILSLYKDLEERLHTNQVQSLDDPYGEHNDISSVHLELKTHALAFYQRTVIP